MGGCGEDKADWPCALWLSIREHRHGTDKYANQLGTRKAAGRPSSHRGRWPRPGGAERASKWLDFFEHLAAVTAERPRGHMEVLELGRVERHVPMASVARDKGTVRMDDNTK